MLHISLWMYYLGKISSRFSKNSEANASELLENIGDIFPGHWKLFVFFLKNCRNNSLSLQSLETCVLCIFHMIEVFELSPLHNVLHKIESLTNTSLFDG